LKATSLFGSVQGLNILLSLVRTKLVAVLLGPEGIGLNSIYNETRELIHASTNLGMDTAGVRGISQTFEQFRNAKSEDERILLHQQFESQVVMLRSVVLLLAALGTFACMLLAQPLSWITFDDFEHTWGYVLLAPAVGLSTLACGEVTVLKAIRKLKAVAIVSAIDVALAIVVSVPLYYMYGINGVLPALLALAVIQFVVIINFSYRAHRVRFDFSKALLSQSIPMIVLGISFALSGVIGHCSQLGIRSFINQLDGLEAVGLFNAGYTIAMTYGGVAFASLDSDYFPRLSGIINNLEERRLAVWRQVRVTVGLLTPLVILLVLVLPWLLPLLFSDRFNDVILMAQISCFGLIFRAAYLPFAYLPLASGDSRTFLAIESVSYLILSAGVILGYYLGGLTGAGIGLVISNAADLLVSFIVAKIKYRI